MTLDIASERVAEVLSLIDRTVKTKNANKALIAIEALQETDKPNSELSRALRRFGEYQDSIRVPDMRDKPVQVTKDIKLQVQLSPSTKDRYSPKLLEQITLFFGSDGKAIKSPAVCLYCKRKTFHGEKCPGCGRLN